MMLHERWWKKKNKNKNLMFLRCMQHWSFKQDPCAGCATDPAQFYKRRVVSDCSFTGGNNSRVLEAIQVGHLHSLLYHPAWRLSKRTFFMLEALGSFGSFRLSEASMQAWQTYESLQENQTKLFYFNCVEQKSPNYKIRPLSSEFMSIPSSKHVIILTKAKLWHRKWSHGSTLKCV